jgi:protein-S-isoprenylcysteine O-methyltransferase Ste14
VLACIALWLGLSLYWSWAATGRSAAKSSESSSSRRLHLILIALGQMLVLFPVPGLRMRFLPSAPALGAAGVVLCAAGVALAVAARRALGRHWSGEVTAKVDHALITTGPYAVVRHPIYSSVFVMYGGTAIAAGEVHALVGIALLGVAYARKIPMEEAVMDREFGAAWRAYRARTKALVPGLL